MAVPMGDRYAPGQVPDLQGAIAAAESANGFLALHIVWDTVRHHRRGRGNGMFHHRPRLECGDAPFIARNRDQVLAIPGESGDQGRLNQLQFFGSFQSPELGQRPGFPGRPLEPPERIVVYPVR